MSDAPLLEELNRHPFTRRLGDAHQATLARCASRCSFPDGVRLAHEGDPVDATYLLLTGRILLKAGRHVVETVEPREVLGWSWLFPGSMWHVDAKTVGVVHAVRLDGEALMACMDEDPAFGLAFTRLILRQLHKRLERARLKGIDVFGGEP